MPQQETFTFQAEIKQLLDILVHSLYTEREIFLRELISNASDALNRAQFEMLTNRDVVDPDAELAIRITADEDAGTLTISVVLDLAVAPINTRFGLIAGLAVTYAVEALFDDLQLTLKWPNDIYLQDRKLAGLLCESRIGGGRQRIVAGIGLNIDPDWRAAGIDPDHLAGGLKAISLLDAGAVVSVTTADELTTGIRDYLLQGAGLLGHGGWPRLLQDIRARDYLQGRNVTINDPTRHFAGQAVGIDDDGRLLVAAGERGLVAVEAGTVSVF